MLKYGSEKVNNNILYGVVFVESVVHVSETHIQNDVTVWVC